MNRLLMKYALRWLRKKIEREGVGWLVDEHWCAIKKTLEEEGFMDEFCAENVIYIPGLAKRACERLLEHMI